MLLNVSFLIIHYCIVSKGMSLGTTFSVVMSCNAQLHILVLYYYHEMSCCVQACPVKQLKDCMLYL